jgi:hypothetical protein
MDDLDKVPSIDVTATPRRSTSSLDAMSDVATPRPRMLRLTLAYALFAACILLGILAFFLVARFFPRSLYHPGSFTIPIMAFRIVVQIGVSLVVMLPLMLLCFKVVSLFLSPEELQRFRSHVEKI